MVETVKEQLAQENYDWLYSFMSDPEGLNDAELNELHHTVIENATENLHNRVVEKRKIDFESKREHYMLRFLYDHAMGAYETGEHYEAQEALGLLSAVSNSKHFQKSLKKHILALALDVDFDTFVTTWVARQGLKHFYISEFTPECEKKYKSDADLVALKTKPFEKLFV